MTQTVSRRQDCLFPGAPHSQATTVAIHYEQCGQAVIGERNAVTLPSRRVGAAAQNVAHCCMSRRRFSNMSLRR